jgi:hypothetical protein
MLRHALCSETETLSTDSSASRRSPSSVHSVLSDIGCGSERRGKEAPVDIWHPDFWNLVDGVQVSNRSAGVAAAGASLDLQDEEESESEEELSLPSCFHQMDDLSEGLSAGILDDDDETIFSDISDPDDGKRALCLHALSLQQSPTNDSTERSESIIGSIVGKKISSSASNQSKSSRKSKKSKSFRVAFSNVYVRQYERILVDNPACRFGVSIGIGWRHNDEEIMDVDEWEESRTERGVRTMSQLAISPYRREALVRKLGYVDCEIAAAMREINRIKCQRRQTANNLKLQHLEETVELAKESLKFVLRSTRRRR